MIGTVPHKIPRAITYSNVESDAVREAKRGRNAARKAVHPIDEPTCVARRSR